jgi:hypothetical protein
MAGEEVSITTSFLNPLVDNNYASARRVSTRIHLGESLPPLGLRQGKVKRGGPPLQQVQPGDGRRDDDSSRKGIQEIVDDLRTGFRVGLENEVGTLNLSNNKVGDTLLKGPQAPAGHKCIECRPNITTGDLDSLQAWP